MAETATTAAAATAVRRHPLPVPPQLGYGAANVGNLYREVSDDDARAVLEAAWDAGIRYYDTAPHYGLGLSERRLGAFLAERPRQEWVLSTKVGRLLVPNPAGAGTLDLAHDFAVPATLRREWDFSPSGIRRSVEESLQRLGVDRIDVVYLHDPERHDLTGALEQGLPAAAALRDEGLVAAVGVGSMSAPALAEVVRRGDELGGVDLLMVAGRWTLLDVSAQDTLDAAAGSGIGVVLASVFNSGLLARPELDADARYEYGPVPPEVRERHRALVELCRRHGVPLAAAALQVGLQHPATAAVVVGTGRAEQLCTNAAAMDVPVPEEFWQQWRDLVRDPLPQKES